jgi:hypothetical protein
MLGVTYADMFTGTIAFMGTNFYTDIVTLDKTEVFEARYIPHDEVAALAKTDCRYVLVTGEKGLQPQEHQRCLRERLQKRRLQVCRTDEHPRPRPPAAESRMAQEGDRVPGCRKTVKK